MVNVTVHLRGFSVSMAPLISGRSPERLTEFRRLCSSSGGRPDDDDDDDDDDGGDGRGRPEGAQHGVAAAGPRPAGPQSPAAAAQRLHLPLDLQVSQRRGWYRFNLNDSDSDSDSLF